MLSPWLCSLPRTWLFLEVQYFSHLSQISVSHSDSAEDHSALSSYPIFKWRAEVVPLMKIYLLRHYCIPLKYPYTVLQIPSSSC